MVTGVLWLFCKKLLTQSALKQAVIIFAITCSICVVREAFSPISYFRNPNAVAISGSKSPPHFSPQMISRNDLKAISESVENVVIDCRFPDAFEYGHISGAYNLPINATLGELLRALETVSHKKKIICYCQNEHCGWANFTARKLDALGLENVLVYAPGWNGWQIEK